MAAKNFTATQIGAFMQDAETKTERPTPTKTKSKAEPVKENTAAGLTIPTGYELKPQAKTKRVQLLLRPALYEALAEQVEKNRAAGIGEKSINGLINELIEQAINK